MSYLLSRVSSRSLRQQIRFTAHLGQIRTPFLSNTITTNKFLHSTPITLSENAEKKNVSENPLLEKLMTIDWAVDLEEHELEKIRNEAKKNPSSKSQEVLEAADVAENVLEFSRRLYQLQLNIGDNDDLDGVNQKPQLFHKEIESVFEAYRSFFKMVDKKWKWKVENELGHRVLIFRTRLNIPDYSIRHTTVLPSLSTIVPDSSTTVNFK
eukprot:c15662_g1_i1.p1 GENE.c15662_g1_i1~~c15662_g1_i1.p1  ORF type:complete len:226 (+),score=82.14 c15662_g1_i1:50-679(+)